MTFRVHWDAIDDSLQGGDIFYISMQGGDVFERTKWQVVCLHFSMQE